MIYVFGAYEFDTDRRILRKEGTPVALEPKVFDLLAYLIQHYDQFVSRGELYAQLWPQQFVSEAALTYCVAEARKAVGDTGRAQRVIKTVHGRGYRFIAPVEKRLPGGAPEGATTAPPPLPAEGEHAPPALQHADTEEGAVEALGQDIVGAERRLLTVLWCHGVASSADSNVLDPEDRYQVMPDVRAVRDEVIRRFEGRIAQDFGDTFVVYFGYPYAHEDDARRAVYTGLEIVRGITQLAQELKRQRAVEFAMHVGIHTGIVAIEAVGGSDTQPDLGDMPHIAAQLASLAAPNTVIISATTLRLIEGYFVCQALGTHILDNLPESLGAYHVLQESTAQRPIDVAIAAGLTPFVGRRHELGLLRERWEQSKEGMGQVVLLSGEAGIGKSRLVQLFQERIVGEGYTWLECYCSPYEQHSPLYPLIDLMQRWLRWRRDDGPPVKFHKLEEALQASGLPLEEFVPPLAVLLTLASAERYPSLDLSPQQQKQQTLIALLKWLMRAAEQQPTCLVIEDLHWVDPSTREFLDLLMNQVATVRMLVLLTYRPDFASAWAIHSHMTPITLNRLTRAQTERMIGGITAGKAMPVKLRQQLVVKTSGVPLFVEEMTKTVLESGLLKEKEGRYELTGPLPTLTIPVTLHDLLMARLDRQGIGKLIAQLGATLGLEFSYEMIQAIAPLDEARLQQGLAQLVSAEILYQHGLPPQAQYLFKHTLIQEAAYQSLLRTTRQQYHQQIAQVLEERFPETRETQPELLAHHYTEAGLGAQAVVYWQRAGQRALERSAYVEAIAHLRQGLTLTPTLAEMSERLQHESTLYMALGTALMATQGYAAPEVEHAYIRARECSRQVGDPSQIFTALHGLSLVYLVRSELRMAYEQGIHLLQLAQSQQEPILLLEAHRVLGSSCFFLGDLATAWTHLTQGLALYETQQHSLLTARYGQDPGMTCLVYAAWILWLRGYPDQALAYVHQALTLAHQCAHSFCLAFAHTFAVMLHWCRRETQAVATQVEASLTLARQHGFPLLVALGTVFQGGILSMQAQGEVGIEQIRQGIEAYRATGAELFRPYFLGLLAEAYSSIRRADAGLEALTEALALMETTGEHLHEAELYRRKGELLLQSGGEDRGDPHAQQSAISNQQLLAEAEACFQRALTVARHQEAKSLELRAALSLSRLWVQQGKRAQARHVLGESYGWFREGFDTGDLREAKTLLDMLQ